MNRSVRRSIGPSVRHNFPEGGKFHIHADIIKGGGALLRLRETNFVQVAFDSLNWASSLIFFIRQLMLMNYIELPIFF